MGNTTDRQLAGGTPELSHHADNVRTFIGKLCSRDDYLDVSQCGGGGDGVGNIIILTTPNTSHYQLNTKGREYFRVNSTHTLSV